MFSSKLIGIHSYIEFLQLLMVKFEIMSKSQHF